MKLFKKCMALFSIALFCLVPLFGSYMTVDASEPTTWFLRYVEDKGAWRFQIGSWEENGYHKDLYYMHQEIKDGDTIVIEGTTPIELEVNVRLGNLTVLNQSTSVVKAKSIDNFYAGKDLASAINCDVTNAYVYGNAAVNFNNNVNYLEITTTRNDGLKANVAVLGTVGHAKAYDNEKTYYEIYNVIAGKFSVTDGALKTEAANYSTIPSAKPAAPTTPTAPSTGSASAGEYDEVPKTGGFVWNPLLLVAIAATCFLGGYRLKRNAK